MYHAQRHEAVDGLDRIDRMTARHGNAGLRADVLATAQHGRNHVVRQHVDRHADDGEREDRLAAHGVDVRERIGRRDTPEVVRVVDDGHEEVGGRDDGLLVVETVDGGVVGRFRADEQIGKRRQRRDALEQRRQHARRDLAAAAAAMREAGEARHGGRGRVARNGGCRMGRFSHDGHRRRRRWIAGGMEKRV
jgi:hypothetical protein